MKHPNQPAFPAFPLLDNFGKPVAPFPGLSRFEFIALQIYLHRLGNVEPKAALKSSLLEAADFLSKLDQIEEGENKPTLKIIP